MKCLCGYDDDFEGQHICLRCKYYNQSMIMNEKSYCEKMKGWFFTGDNCENYIYMNFDEQLGKFKIKRMLVRIEDAIPPITGPCDEPLLENQIFYICPKCGTVRFEEKE